MQHFSYRNKHFLLVPNVMFDMSLGRSIFVCVALCHEFLWFTLLIDHFCNTNSQETQKFIQKCSLFHFETFSRLVCLCCLHRFCDVENPTFHLLSYMYGSDHVRNFNPRVHDYTKIRFYVKLYGVLSKDSGNPRVHGTRVNPS